MSAKIIGVDWNETTQIEGYIVNLGQGYIDGKWYAAHARPFFCFEGADRLEVIDIASRALAWYRSLPAPPSRVQAVGE